MIITVWNNRHFLFTDFLDPVFFTFSPHSSLATCQKPRFLNELLNTFFLIDIDIRWKAALLNLSFIWRNWDHLRSRPVISNRWTKLILGYFLGNVNVDGKHLRQIKEIDIQQRLPIETTFWLVADEEVGQKRKKTGSRKSEKENGGCFSYSYDSAGGAGRLHVALSPFKNANLVVYLG